MKRRPTLKASLRLARVALSEIAPQERGNSLASMALRLTADPLPVDMGQLRRMANGFAASDEGWRAACNAVDACIDGPNLHTVDIVVESFLTYIKENAK